MNLRLLCPLALAIPMLALPPEASAHCQIPCGVYGDQARIDAMLEDITTIEKAMKAIPEAGKAGDWNQLVRWISNKESHAQNIQQTVLDYWLVQRIKLPDLKQGGPEAHQVYLEKLEVLHHILVHAMKAKQTTDLTHVKKLRELVDRFHGLYFDTKKKKHLKEHHHHGPGKPSQD